MLLVCSCLSLQHFPVLLLFLLSTEMELPKSLYRGSKTSPVSHEQLSGAVKVVLLPPKHSDKVRSHCFVPPVLSLYTSISNSFKNLHLRE